MTKARVELRRFLTDLALYAILHSLAATVLFFASRSYPVVLLSLCTAVPFFTMGVARWHLKNPWLFFGLLVLLAAGSVVVPLPAGLPAPLVFRITCVCLLLLAGAYFAHGRLHGLMALNMGVLIAGLALDLALVLCAQYFAFAQITPVLVAWAYVLLVCWLVCGQLLRVDNTLGTLSGEAAAPTRSILRFSNVLLVGFLVLLSVVLLLSPYLPLQPLLELLGAGIVLLLRFLFGNVSSESSSVVEEKPAPAESPGDMPISEAEANPVLQAIVTVLGYLVMAAVAVIGVLLLLRLLLAVFRRIQAARPAEDTDFRESIDPMDMESGGGLAGLARGLGLWRPSFGAGRAARVRRAYYKKVRQYARKGAVQLGPGSTTSEIEAQIAAAEDISALTEAYNQARYGPEV